MPEMQSDNFPEIWCTIFYESKLKLIRFVMMVYFFTKRNRTNAQTNNNGSILQDNKYSFLLFDLHLSYCQKYKVNFKNYHCYWSCPAIKVELSLAIHTWDWKLLAIFHLLIKLMNFPYVVTKIWSVHEHFRAFNATIWVTILVSKTFFHEFKVIHKHVSNLHLSFLICALLSLCTHFSDLCSLLMCFVT